MEHPIIITSKGKIVKRKRQEIYNNVISNYISSPHGRAALAASMAQPIRTRLSYQGIARQLLPVQQLPQGALPYYNYSIEPEGYKYDAVKITSRGKVYRKGDLSKLVGRVTIPTFQIYSNPTIRLSDVKSRRFNLIDRAVHKAKAVIMAQEDEQIFKALDSLGSGNKEE
jgi:hypothetical protein